MKHAYLIIAHKNWNQLMTLLTLLDDSRNDIYLHVDRRVADVPWEQLQNAVQKARIVFVKRLVSAWGDYSLVEAELLLLEEATRSYHSYYHLLSGQDLPLKTQKEIHDFFRSEPEAEYVVIKKASLEDAHSPDKRQRYYYFFLRWNTFLDKSGIAYLYLRRFQKLSLLFQKWLGVNRIKGIEDQLYYGSQWFSITDAFARYLLTQKAYINKHFRWTVIPDEHFVQTVLMRSPFKDRAAQVKTRCIDWRWDKPYVFTAADYELLRSSDCLFARKFDETTDPEIISMIVRDIRNCSHEEHITAETQKDRK